ncbi:MAG TPA: nucleotide sugar dehydrogenase [Caulobacteraceae bacterium]|nr:nucleotide sugar dehydrogenase [Caulobacteraceae bacterium]
MLEGGKTAAGASAEVVVVGCGAIGLPLAVAFASAGAAVLGLDTDPARLERLAAGDDLSGEPDLAVALQEGLAGGRIAFAAGPPPTDRSRVYVIAVPTPAAAGGGLDAEPLGQAMAAIARDAGPGALVCVRSTVPIGTTRTLAAAWPGLAFAATPDRSVAGRAYREQFEIPHLVGGLDGAAGEAAEALFARLGPVVRTADPETAEAIKLFANAARDATFALANQFALVCEATGVDFEAVRVLGAAGFPRLSLARAGPVGGPCLSKDLELLLASQGVVRAGVELLAAARRLNGELPEHVARAIGVEITARGEAARAVAVLGLAFKGEPPTSDRRGAFAGALIERLQAAHPDLEVRAWDPVSDGHAARRAALDGAAIVVLANDHPALGQGLADELRAGAIVFDMTGGFQPTVGFDVRRLGDGRGGGITRRPARG